MMNNTRNNCINVDETVAVAATTTTTTTAAAAVPEFVQLNETRRYIYRVIAAIHDDESFNKLMNRLLRRFERAIREEFESAQNSPLLCRKLARSIIALTDQIHTLQKHHGFDESDTSLYRQRICYIVAIYIACELCAAQDHVEKDRCILERISSMLSLYVENGVLESCGHKENTLLTLVAIPKVFGQANIITVLYSRLFPQWSVTPSFFTQTELPDKIYIECIIIFYCWQRLERHEPTKQRIIEFASKFMRPSSTLPFNPIYINYLPDYGASRTATRTILDYLNMQQSCTGLRAASRIDNRSQTQTNDELVFDSDEEKSAAESGLVLVSTMTTIPTLPPAAPDPPDFLKPLCENASRLEPVKRAAALYRGIDSSCEVFDLCESDDEVEMFSLDFNVPANVDGSASSSNEASATVDDDYVPITRIFPSNLRTYQRATSGATNVPATVTTSEIYTMPRIVNSYSFRRDSLHLVSTTQTPPHLVDQCVQTAEQQENQQNEQIHHFDDDAISTCMFPGMISVNSNSNTEDRNNPSPTYNHHCHQSSSRNSNSSEASLLKKQVTFSSQHLGALSSSKFRKVHKMIKPSIKRYKDVNNSTRVSLTPTSSTDHVETLKWMGRKEHLQAGQRMFSKLEAKKYCDKRTTKQSISSGKRKASVKRVSNTPTTHLTPTTSNASSGTPTPQPNRLQATSGPQRSLPTPPASTHSSSGGIDIDINQLKADSSSYKFDRNKFADKSTDHIRLYSNLLKLQRIKMQEKRDKAAVLKKKQKITELKTESQDEQIVQREQETLIHVSSINKFRHKVRIKLRKASSRVSERSQNADKLESESKTDEMEKQPETVIRLTSENESCTMETEMRESECKTAAIEKQTAVEDSLRAIELSQDANEVAMELNAEEVILKQTASMPDCVNEVESKSNNCTEKKQQTAKKVKFKINKGSSKLQGESKTGTKKKKAKAKDKSKISQASSKAAELLHDAELIDFNKAKKLTQKADMLESESKTDEISTRPDSESENKNSTVKKPAKKFKFKFNKANSKLQSESKTCTKKKKTKAKVKSQISKAEIQLLQDSDILESKTDTLEQQSKEQIITKLEAMPESVKKLKSKSKNNTAKKTGKCKKLKNSKASSKNINEADMPKSESKIVEKTDAMETNAEADEILRKPDPVLRLESESKPDVTELQLTPKISADFNPVVRLERIRVSEMIVPLSDVEESFVKQTNRIQETMGSWNRRRRRRKKNYWSRMKNFYKRKLDATAALNTGIPSDLNETQLDQSIAASSDNEMLTSEPSASTTNASVPSVTPAIITSTTVLSPESTTSLPAAIALDQNPTEQDYGIAAYVTLSANGECCDEQDAVVKQINQLPTSSPETEQSSVMSAHEIEVATSNVPVYLLNGESRDVTTPLPATLPIEDVAPDP